LWDGLWPFSGKMAVFGGAGAGIGGGRMMEWGQAVYYL
jgi:hypothetical protein